MVAMGRDARKGFETVGMSALGQKQTCAVQELMSAFGLERTTEPQSLMSSRPFTAMSVAVRKAISFSRSPVLANTSA